MTARPGLRIAPIFCATLIRLEPKTPAEPGRPGERLGILSQRWEPRMLRDMAIACCFSPDGSQVAFGTNRDREIWVMDANGADAHKVLESRDDNGVFMHTWSADSRRLIYSREKSNALVNVLSRDLQMAQRLRSMSTSGKTGGRKCIAIARREKSFRESRAWIHPPFMQFLAGTE